MHTYIHTYIHAYAYIRAIGDLTCLICLDFTHIYNCTDNGLCELGKLIHLCSLSLDRTCLEDFGLSSLAPLVKLEYLSLRGTDITGIGFRDLAGLTVLNFLELRGCYNLTDDGILACARAFTALEYLGLGYTVGGCLTSAA